MPTNEAAWLLEKHTTLDVKAAPYVHPKPDEIVIKNAAVAINPVDRLAESMGEFIFPWVHYPFIFGSDCAGTVVEIGANVRRFKVGDRVVGHAVGADKGRNCAAEGAFQLYTVLLEHMASPLPDRVSYEEACVLPLGLSTAACGLFQKDFLALQPPAATPVVTGKTVLVWGGSTSVGSNAIQLAVAAGYEVITTASPKNFDYVKRLGARHVVDYRSRSCVAELIAAVGDRELAGALAIGLGSAGPCLDIVGACRGRKFVALASAPVSFDTVPLGRGRLLALLPTIGRMILASVGQMLKARWRGVRTKFIFGTTLQSNEVGPLIYVEFLPAALAEGRYRAAPEPRVIGAGLGSLQAALAVQKEGVSAQKLVVTL
jgi:NADPH:quinone reductase-like Zn-dependent oxidoreductase